MTSGVMQIFQLEANVKMGEKTGLKMGSEAAVAFFRRKA